MVIAVPGSEVSALRSLKRALLGSICQHRTVLGVAMLALLPSAQALAQCASAPTGPLNQSSGACVESNVTRNGAGAQGAVSVSNNASYDGTGVTLTAPSGVATVTVNGTASLLLTDSSVTANGAAGLRQFSGTGGLSGTNITSTATGNAVGVDVRSGTLTIGSSAGGATHITATSSGTGSGAGVALQTSGSSAVINATDAVLQASGQSSNTNAGAFATAGTINLTGGSITVSGSGSNGLWGNSGTTINANGVDIHAGLYGAITSGTINLGVDTRNPSTPVHTVINAGSIGIYATGGSVTGTDAEVISGNSGVVIVQAGKVDLTGGSITAVTGVSNVDTSQGGRFIGSGVAISTAGVGVSTSGANSVSTLQDNGTTHTTITTSNGATGIRVRSGGQTTGSGVVVNASGIGVDASGANTRVTLQDGSSGGNATVTADGTALRAMAGASAVGTNAVLTTTGAATGATYGVYANSATVDLTGGSVTAQGANGIGIFADGGVTATTITATGTTVETTAVNAIGVRATAGSSVTLTDSDVSTALDNAHGAYADGGTIVMTRTDITTLGAGASAAYAEHGAITLNNSNTFSYGDNALAGVASGGGSALVLNNSYVNLYGNNGAGLFAIDGGTIVMSGGAVVTGDYYGGTIIADSPGMIARGTVSSIRVSNGASSATYGANSPAIWADAGGEIEFSGYGVFTYQPNSPGALATGTGSALILTNTIDRTTGPSSAGVRVTGGAQALVTGSEITTGYRMTGSNPPVLQFPDAQIGLESHGADVVGTGSRLQAENNRITTRGDGAIGVKVSQGGTASVTGGTVTTHGAATATVGGADGLRATDAGSTIALTRTAVTTAGAAAFGVRADNAGAVQITGGSVATSGSAAHGIATIDGSTITASGTTVGVSGAGSTAIYVAGSAPSTVSATGGGLSAVNGAIVRAEGGTGTVSISGGTTITPGVVNGRLLLAQVTENAAGTPSNLTLNISGIPALTGDILVDPSTLTYNLGNSNWTGNLVLTGPGNTAIATLTTSQWTGDLLADAGNTADVALTQGSLWTGLARNATNVGIDASSAWHVTGDSNATGTGSNAGLIQFLPRTDAYSTLTVGNYVGTAGSRIGFNTYLGADNSPSNLLVINGGRASGTSSLLVSNTGGPGALTTADGIRLVQVTGGGTTATDAFTLSNRAAAGAYEYQLFRSGSTSADDWFLRSHIIVSQTPSQPASTPEPEPVQLPNYRVEVPVDTVVPALANRFGLAMLGTYHDRVGEDYADPATPAPAKPIWCKDPAKGFRCTPTVQQNSYYADAATGEGERRKAVWGRVFGETGSVGYGGKTTFSRYSNFEKNGPSYDFGLAGAQIGMDLYRKLNDNGTRDIAGLYIGAGRIDSEVNAVYGGKAGSTSMDGYSLGAYWTRKGDSGWYVDAVVQGTWYDRIRTNSVLGESLKTDGWGFTASLEAGYPIALGQGWAIEPQAQVIYQRVSIDGGSDSFGRVKYDDTDAFYGRLGARLTKGWTFEDGRSLTVWGRANLWHTFGADAKTTFSGLSGANPVTLNTDLGGTWAQFGLGVSGQVTRDTSVFASGDYNLALGNANGHSLSGRVGLRIVW